MAIYKFSNAGGFANYTRYNDFLAGNPAVILDKGSMYPLGVFTLSSSQANVEFTNIPQTYTHLQIRGIARNTQAANEINLITVQFNGDTGSNYARHYIFGNGSTATSAAQTSQTVGWVGQVAAANTTANTFSGLVVDILDYRNTNKNTTVRSLSGADLNGSGEILYSSVLWNNTAAITSIRLASSTANLGTNSSFALYGIL